MQKYLFQVRSCAHRSYIGVEGSHFASFRLITALLGALAVGFSAFESRSETKFAWPDSTGGASF
jgi:hypothetical protein